MIDKTFPDQRENEKIVHIFRKHWFAIWPNIASSAFLLSLATIILSLPLFVSIEGDVKKLLMLLDSILYLAAIITFYIAWVMHYLTVGILTSERILDIDQNSLISRKLAFARLENIEDVQVDVTGIINTIFKIGTVKVMTAGEVPSIEFPFIKEPYQLLDKTRHAQEKSPYIYKRNNDEASAGSVEKPAKPS
ncbi:TPA: hypothetical protein DDW69_02715 [candidate division CPR2 bacterium]|uniref:DUF304 domain-containing protein n=1 Tax=candidate division CPR2 bacterium GW2011_GWC1_41_48 TaxID=1618344 RepID=A0A0G0Z848_UNCC2|nr:MAG: hypothetical protein UT47_C0003G0254 [candidate division CPR2 bacterium GW2011_GWC2_39_35]KKR28193.1 MAG: hypothetical protein UT59_C0033G0010 [candidate division CPR2 bacterium GW2011_GWD1_39_7]KKR29273.1 MAG: hypothetical protein UT60_C0004G0010 [candidate division CPR2 bacterium GW2011_GWD2_39_7]KKS09193.1 MAG: hypothetical protein UU65_C0003G0248 [candidate division CPR2 bacterium GW2011_GWC1_41_48]OGB60362.1 MAG: hypothetical protein A2Y27_03120 [candidate division CPR2 bacterium G